MKTRLMLMIKIKIIKISEIISNLKKINKIINLIIIMTTQQYAMIKSLIIFVIIQNCSKNQRTKLITENLTVLFAKSRNIEKINV